MSGLVSYESSSDDEETVQPTTVIPSVPAALQVNHSKGEGARNHTPTAEHADGGDNALMVGPAMPEDFTADGIMTDRHQEIATDPYLANLSEQDLVRHLTQASLPLTALPPSPPGSPNPTIEAKFKRFLELKSKGLHFNDDLAKKSTFRNPGLLNTLMARAGIDGTAQHASSLPASVWDPQTLPAYAYKEELAKNQQNIRDREWARKKNEAQSGKRTIEFTSAGASATSSGHSTPGFRQKEIRS